jgi:hypothetical protein
MNIVDLGPAAQRLADLVARVADDELGKPTPCLAYTLGDAPAGPDVPFGPSRQLPGDAPLLDRVLALAGRDPEWAPP